MEKAKRKKKNRLTKINFYKRKQQTNIFPQPPPPQTKIDLKSQIEEK